MKAKFFVSRQIYWLENTPVVEVAEGGLDYANPDMLVEKYPGERAEFNDPVEAVKTAIDICRLWRRDGEKNAKVAIGFTGGNTIPFEPVSFKEALKIAKKIAEKLPKCGYCGDFIDPDEPLELDTGEVFCSEYCFERAEYLGYLL